MSTPSFVAKLFSFFLLLCSFQSAVAGEFFKEEIMIGEEAREYYVYIPSQLKDKTNRPAIIAFHGFKSDAKGFRWLIQPDKWADKHGFVMIYPNAIKKSWNAGKGMGRQNKTTDDDRFAAELPSVVADRHDIDNQRIYAMGFSNGAQVVAKLLCHHSVQIAGAAMVAQSLNEDDCRPAYKVPVVIMHGMQDPAAPYKGGGKFKLASHTQSVEYLKDWYEIKGKKQQIKGDKTYKCSEYSEGKKASTSVIGCSLFNNGHQWPGSRDFLVKQLGTTNKNLSANDFIMSFFKRYKGVAPYMGKSKAAVVTAKK
jgi:polyhydroxybutyrate depolymerase